MRGRGRLIGRGCKPRSSEGSHGLSGALIAGLSSGMQRAGVGGRGGRGSRAGVRGWGRCGPQCMHAKQSKTKPRSEQKQKSTEQGATRKDGGGLVGFARCFARLVWALAVESVRCAHISVSVSRSSRAAWAGEMLRISMACSTFADASKSRNGRMRVVCMVHGLFCDLGRSDVSRVRVFHPCTCTV